MKSDQLASEHVYNTDVLVVGAGPVGLLAAGELTRRGIACRIIDKNAERSKYSRALAIQPRTMEILDLAEAGLADEFVRRAYTSPGLSLPVDSNPGRQAIIDMNFLDTRFPFITVLHRPRQRRSWRRDWRGSASALSERVSYSASRSKMAM